SVRRSCGSSKGRRICSKSPAHFAKSRISPPRGSRATSRERPSVRDRHIEGMFIHKWRFDSIIPAIKETDRPSLGLLLQFLLQSFDQLLDRANAVGLSCLHYLLGC